LLVSVDVERQRFNAARLLRAVHQGII